ncbi:hypothetical protein ABT160_04515 [Streptomyces sp. NPDC001941]|uniref:hypothetical protein n=1 Tax=Streptomyces sp. NPDC001941 TaxID=3154659 RepID=UPI0033258F04
MLNDSREAGNRKRSPNWEREEQMAELHEMMEIARAGDYVIAFGKDTRGHEVRREGTLLVDLKEMTATHEGGKVPALRACVGARGADPQTRATWTTLIAGHGRIERAEPPAAGEWIHDEVRNIPAVRSKTNGSSAYILWGGKGGKRSSKPKGKGTLAEPVYTAAGRYEIRAVHSGDVLFAGTLQSHVWWAPAPEEDQEQAAKLGQPVYHVRTRELVGYWTEEKFTPVD